MHHVDRHLFATVFISVASSLALGTLVLLSSEESKFGLALIVVLLLVLAVGGHLRLLTLQNICLALWSVLVSHRAFIPRAESVAMSGVEFTNLFAEICITVGLFVGTLCTAIAWVCAGRRITLSRVGFWLLVYALFALVSTVWTPNRPYAGFWTLRLLSAVALSIIYSGLTGGSKHQQFTTVTTIALLPHLALPIIASVGATSVSRADLRIAGFWFHPTVAGILAFSIFAMYLAHLLQRGLRRTPATFTLIAAFSLISGLLAGGKAGALGAIVGVGMLLIMARSPGVWARTILASLIVGAAIWNFQLLRETGLLAHWQYYSKILQFGTLYSRFDLWQRAIQMWLDSPWALLFGHGFTSARVLGIESVSGTWTTTHAHNSFLQALVELGAFGTVPLFAMILILIHKILINSQTLGLSPVLPMIVGFAVLLVGSFFDNVFGGLPYGPFYLLVAIALSIEQLPSTRPTRPRRISARSKCAARLTAQMRHRRAGQSCHV